MKAILFFFSAVSLFPMSSWGGDEYDHPETPLPTPQTPHSPLDYEFSNITKTTPSRKRKNQGYIQATTLKKVKIKKNAEKEEALELLMHDIAEKASEDPTLILTNKDGFQKMALKWWDSDEYGLKKMFPETQLTQAQKTKAGKKAIELYNQKIAEQQQRLCEEKQRVHEEQQRVREEKKIRKDMNFTQPEKEKVILRARIALIASQYAHQNFYLDMLDHHEEIGLFNTRANDNWYTALGFSEKYEYIFISKRDEMISRLRKLIFQAAEDLKNEETSVSSPPLLN